MKKASIQDLTPVLLLLAGATAFAQQPTPSRSPVDPDLRGKTATRLAAVAAGLDGVLGYAILDLASGDRFGHADRKLFPTASTIKVAVLYELFRQAEEGKLALDEPRPLDRRRAVPGGVLYDMGTPSLSLRDHAVLMIVLSDNTAANVLIERVGMEAVNTRLRSLGLTDTRLRRYMIDSAAARRGDENVSTPADLARLLEAIHKGEGLHARSREEILALLQKDKIPTTAVALGVPPGVTIAGKDGNLEGVRTDTAIVFAKNRPYVIVAMTAWLADEAAGERAITELSRAAYEYFARLGAATSYGRLIDR